MDCIKQNLDLLSKINLLPKILNVIVVEYMFSMYTENELDVHPMYACHPVVQNNKIYMYKTDYFHETLKIHSCYDDLVDEKCDKFDNPIYVFDGRKIIIFNQKCEHIGYVKFNYDFNPDITNKFEIWPLPRVDQHDVVVLNNTIFAFSILREKKKIIMFSFLEKVAKEGKIFSINSQFVRDINFDSAVYSLKTNRSFLYVLLKHNKIVKLSDIGEKLDEYVFDFQANQIYDFCVADDEIYIIFDSHVPNTFVSNSFPCIYIYELKNNKSHNIFKKMLGYNKIKPNLLRTIRCSHPYTIDISGNILYFKVPIDDGPERHFHVYLREKISLLKS